MSGYLKQTDLYLYPPPVLKWRRYGLNAQGTVGVGAGFKDDGE